MENNFVICNNDGDTTVYQIDKPTLLERIKEHYYGNVSFRGGIVEKDTNYWGDSILIIKGKIATPKAIEVVTEHDID